MATIDATFEDLPPTDGPAIGRRVVAGTVSRTDALADLLEASGDVASAGATVARLVSESAAARADQAAEVAHAGADTVRTAAAAVAHIQAESNKAAGPVVGALLRLRDKARAAGILGPSAPGRGIHRGAPRPVGVRKETPR